MLTAANLSRSFLKTQNPPGSKPALPFRTRTFRIAIAAMITLLVVTTCAARAQSTFGSIRGTVTDASGAVIEGATVKLHSLDESADRQTTTNASGDFLFENLKAGHYKVTVSHAGFTDAVVSSATLEARQELRLPVTLTVTAGTTTVEVSADAALMNTENGT